MRSLTYLISVSIDGYIAGPDDQFDAFTFDGDFAAWLLREYPETLPIQARAALGIADVPARHFDTVIMGRRTFEPGLAAGLPSVYPHLRQIVVSGSLPADQPEVEVVADDPAATVRELKSVAGQGIWLCGGGRLASTLAGEIDELVIKRQPVVLGAGRPLFAGEYAPQPWQLQELRRFDSGVAIERYTR